MAGLPGLFALWDPVRNTRSPGDVAAGSTGPAWWRCPVAAAHVWEAAVQSVRNSACAGNTGCPFCRGLRPSADNSLAERAPAGTLALWDATANDRGPESVVAGSNKPYWWVCPGGPDHRWQAPPVTMRDGGGCPFCANRRVSVTNRLDVLHPGLAGGWHPARNGTLTPADVVATSHRKVWWQCPADPDHEWQAGVGLRVARGHGCPYCSGRRATRRRNLAALWPAVAAMWHDGNPDRPEDLAPASDRVRRWQCPLRPDHRWDAAVKTVVAAARRGKSGCPQCAGKAPSTTNSVTAHPALSQEWHPTRNAPLRPDEVVAGTGRHLWWRCTADPAHEWEATGANRTRGRGCPWCKDSLRGALEVCLAHELGTLFPDLDPAGGKVRVGPRELLSVDILLPAQRVAVEVDGRYRHLGAEARDARKSERLRAAGWRVLRVREHPLAPLHDHDVQVREDPTVKETADAVLRRLRDLGWADPDGLAAYLAEPSARRQDDTLAALSVERGGARVNRPGAEKGPNRPERWEASLVLLTRFAAREGHSSPPGGHQEDGRRLGAWVQTQRARHRRSVLEPGRAARLEELPGWTWDPDGAAFKDWLSVLTAYVARTGHGYVPVNHAEDGRNLGMWVRGIQTGRTRLTGEQRTLVERTPGWTWDRRAYVLGQPGETLF